MKNFFTVFLFFSFTQLFATNIDSVQYQKKWYYVYPIEQVGSINSKGSISTGVSKNEIIIPLTNVPDGTYVQFLNTRTDDNHKSLDWYHGSGTSKKSKPTKYKWNYKTTSNDRIPYALFEIRDNKLNGKVFFLNAKGFVVAQGQYLDNLKDGKWFEGNNYQYQTYKNGLLNGLSYEESIYNKKKKNTALSHKKIGLWMEN